MKFKALFAGVRRASGPAAPSRSRGALSTLAVGFALIAPAFARAAGMADIWAAVDLVTTAESVFAAGVLVIGIHMAFKGTQLGKRTVRSV